MAIILLLICYLCYVQFCFQVYGEAKEMLIIALFIQSENMEFCCYTNAQCQLLLWTLLLWAVILF
jgi:hypothetical protein